MYVAVEFGSSHVKLLTHPPTCACMPLQIQRAQRRIRLAGVTSAIAVGDKVLLYLSHAKSYLLACMHV